MHQEAKETVVRDPELKDKGQAPASNQFSLRPTFHPNVRREQERDDRGYRGSSLDGVPAQDQNPDQPDLFPEEAGAQEQRRSPYEAEIEKHGGGLSRRANVRGDLA